MVQYIKILLHHTKVMFLVFWDQIWNFAVQRSGFTSKDGIR